MKTTIEMAREAGLFQDNGDGQGAWWVSNQIIEAFAELVRADAIADERAACLAIADYCGDSDMHASMAANFIRARSNT